MQPAVLLAINWSDLLVNAVMPLVGIALIIVFVLSFFLKFGTKIEGSKQLIKGFGLDVQVSVRTLLMLGGLALVFTSVFLQIQQNQLEAKEQQINELNAKLESAREEASRAGRHVIRAFLLLPRDFDATLDRNEIECVYFLSIKPEQAIPASLMEGRGGNSVGVILTDLRAEDVILELQLRRKGSGKILALAENIYPLQPIISLKTPGSGPP